MKKVRKNENIQNILTYTRNIKMDKQIFKINFRNFVHTLQSKICKDSEWKIKGFIDDERNIFSLSNDTKVISKILEIHIFPYVLDFANTNYFDVILPNHQNYYPDLSFVFKKDPTIKFAVDLKTTYRNESNSNFCNGFTLGSHGEYFKNRESHKNIQFPYKDYQGHFCLGVIYDRVLVDEFIRYELKDLDKIQSVIKNIDDILNERGVFANLGEKIFDDYWINYGQITITDSKGNLKKITKLEEYLQYRGKSYE